MSNPDINYYTPNSDVTLLGLGAGGSPPTQHWRPGDAGLRERAALGAGTGDGWFVYFYGRWLVCEVWVGGAWEFTRRVDCGPLLSVGGGRWRNVVAFGWDLQASTVSLGCVSRDAGNPDDARSVHQTFYVPNLARVFAHPPQVYLGSAPVQTGPGESHLRALDATVSTVGGRVVSRTPLTAGELARLSGREVRYA